MRMLLAITLLMGSLVAQDQTLPSVTLKDLKNKPHRLELLVEGQVTLINFWATYCVPCRKEMKHLDRIHATYADSGAQVIGISIDNARTVGRVKSLVRSQKLDYPILLDTEQKLYKNFNTSAMPFSILVNTNGEIVWQHTGYIPGDEVGMEDALKKALAAE